MFNTYIRKDGDSHTHVTQQPNDAADAARLHGEIRTKAEREARHATLETFGAHNEIRGVMYRETRLATDEVAVRCDIQINGNDYTLNVRCPRHDTKRKLNEEIVHLLLAEFLDKLPPSADGNGR